MVLIVGGAIYESVNGNALAGAVWGKQQKCQRVSIPRDNDDDTTGNGSAAPRVGSSLCFVTKESQPVGELCCLHWKVRKVYLWQTIMFGSVNMYGTLDARPVMQN